jgi:murein tripeptide amidase MpaA
MEELSTRFPALTQFISLGQSIEGREIWALKISDQAEQEENEPNIYITGCHHAREWISVEIPLEFGQYLLNQYHEQSRIRQLVDTAQLYIIPILNPDGLEFSIHTYRLWRKNRRYLGDFIWGVDLNRNYSHAWAYDDIGSSPDPASEVYRGPAPFSEPEIQVLRDYLYQHPPSGMLNFHNYSQLILIPWGFTAELPADYDEMFSMARKMNDLIKAVHGRSYEFGSGATAIYPTNGDSDDWVYGTFGTPSFTIELPPVEFDEGHFFTSEEEIVRTVAEMLPAMLYFAEYTRDHFIPRSTAPGGGEQDHGKPIHPRR